MADYLRREEADAMQKSLTDNFCHFNLDPIDRATAWTNSQPMTTSRGSSTGRYMHRTHDACGMPA
jgi:hypothetical protein